MVYNGRLFKYAGYGALILWGMVFILSALWVIFGKYVLKKERERRERQSYGAIQPSAKKEFQESFRKGFRRIKICIGLLIIYHSLMASITTVLGYPRAQLYAFILVSLLIPSFLFFLLIEHVFKSILNIGDK